MAIPAVMQAAGDPAPMLEGNAAGSLGSTSAPPSPSITGRNYDVTQTLSAHTRGVTALRFSNDGRTLVSAGADGWLHFWNPENGEHIRGFRCHKTGINDISISPDSLYLATASDDCTSQIHHLYPPPSGPDLVSTSASASSSSPSISKPVALRTLSAHTAPILSIAFSPKSNLLVTGSFDESAIIWDVRRGKVLRVLPAHADAIWSVGWDREGGMVLTAGADGLIRLWDANSGQCLKTIDNDTNSPVSFASFTPSSYFLLSATLSSTLRIYNIHTSKVLKTLQAPGTYVSEKFPCPAVVFAAPLLSGTPEPLSSEPDPESGAGAQGGQSDKMDIDGEESATSRDTATNGIGTGRDSGVEPTNELITEGSQKRDAWVVTGSENGKLVVWDIQSKRVVQVLEGDEGHKSTVVAIAVHPSGQIIASGSLEPEKAVKLWRVGAGI